MEINATCSIQSGVSLKKGHRRKESHPALKNALSEIEYTTGT